MTRSVLVAAAGALLLGVTLTGVRAVAAYEHIVDAGQPGLLTLSVDAATPVWSRLSAGETTHWLVRAELTDATTASFGLELVASGKLVDAAGLTAAVTACSAGFVERAGRPRCSGTSEPVLATTPLRDLAHTHTRYTLADLTADAPREFLVTLRLPDTATRAELTDARARVGLGLFAAGETVDPEPPTPEPPGPEHPTPEPPGPATPGPETPGAKTPPDPTGATPAAGPTAGSQLALTGGDVAALALVATGLLGIGIALATRGTARRGGATHPGGRQ
ncbi:hypothetical protein [Leucobacter luti]|nr:hypothetical protein [Leucobacter luti]MBL3699096.1 hypothetical protein [Leucobacter luti]